MMGVPTEKFATMLAEAESNLEDAIDYADEQTATDWPVADPEEVDLLRIALNLVRRVT